MINFEGIVVRAFKIENSPFFFNNSTFMNKTLLLKLLIGDFTLKRLFKSVFLHIFSFLFSGVFFSDHLIFRPIPRYYTMRFSILLS